MKACMEIRQPLLKNQLIAAGDFLQTDKDEEIRIM